MTTAGSLTPRELVDQARRLLADTPTEFAGVWPRAVAVLTRQALEAAVDDLWRVRSVPLEQASARAQFLCLDAYLRDQEVASACRHTWSALSRACHHHPYELAPTIDELERWMVVVDQLLDRLEAAEVADSS